MSKFSVPTGRPSGETERAMQVANARSSMARKWLPLDSLGGAILAGLLWLFEMNPYSYSVVAVLILLAVGAFVWLFPIPKRLGRVAINDRPAKIVLGAVVCTILGAFLVAEGESRFGNHISAAEAQAW